ncbi:unnamed protein product [Adineta steineri]|uniref:G-protein coupled receptors family 1 profile domain-containing protein n=1 Tax=Adineta steineri TaxID=433720 RepID=A0A819ML11_9BILA|nr:unnamed protein product [Adineta steineri]CAF3982731.1 unnamed protein product [Adineta steineri]
MSNSTISSLNFASQQVVIYVGFFIFIGGVIGNPLTLLVFLSLRTFRESSCAFYLIAMSTINICHLFTGTFTYIMINGFKINWLNMSIFYCKFRAFYVQFCILTSFSCMCLAIIDQFMATCSNPRWHQWNNIKLARYILAGTILCWILHGIPFILYYGYTVSSITGVLPMTIIILFGILSYRDIQQIAYRTIPLVRRELDKQLTVMVLVQIIFDVIAVSPLVIQSIFRAVYNTPNDPLISAQLNLLGSVTTIMNNFHFVSSFYIYICASKRFRQQFIHVLFTIHHDRLRRGNVNNNQIQPQT